MTTAEPMADRVGPGTPARRLKRILRERLAAGDLDAVADAAEITHQVIGALITLTYDADPEIAWRAVDAAGRAADRIATDQPDPVRTYLRRLFWLITEESGGICWFAPQTMAEIARTRAAFGDFVPVTMNLLNQMAAEDLAHFRPGILWAIGRLGPLAAEYVDDVLPAMEAALGHPDAQVRGLAAWALGEVGRGAVVAARPELTDDPGAVQLYREGTLASRTVGELVSAVRASTAS